MIKKVYAKLYSMIFWEYKLGDIINILFDLKSFYKYRFTTKFKFQENYEAFLIKQYHIIEKGLALPSPRLNFGLEKIKILIEVSEEYHNRFNQTNLLQTIASTLKNYLIINSTLEDFDSKMFNQINQFIVKYGFDNEGGIKYVNPKNNFEFKDFALSRSSVRIFNKKSVDENIIKEAVEIAKSAPSVCNRQAWKVHAYCNRKQMLDLLKCQDGNSGFGENFDKLLLITVDSKNFTNLELNQMYTDGGLFSMNLLLALHSLEIGACCLNLCVPFVKAEEIKKIGNVDSSEKLIMMIGIGHYDNNTKVAVSKRKKIKQILLIHN